MVSALVGLKAFALGVSGGLGGFVRYFSVIVDTQTDYNSAQATAMALYPIIILVVQLSQLESPLLPW